MRSSMRLSLMGIGPARIGMTAAEMRAAVAGRWRSEEAPEGCYYMSPEVQGLGFMMLKGRLGRVDVHGGPWRSVSGARIGSTEREIEGLYGPMLRVEKHKYEPAGKYMIVVPGEEKHRGMEMLFETDGRVVKRFRAGTAEAVALVEGCS